MHKGHNPSDDSSESEIPLVDLFTTRTVLDLQKVWQAKGPEDRRVFTDKYRAVMHALTPYLQIDSGLHMLSHDRKAKFLEKFQPGKCPALPGSGGPCVHGQQKPLGQQFGKERKIVGTAAVSTIYRWNLPLWALVPLWHVDFTHAPWLHADFGDLGEPGIRWWTAPHRGCDVRYAELGLP